MGTLQQDNPQLPNFQNTHSKKGRINDKVAKHIHKFSYTGIKEVM
jgi:hypothetical protein